MIWHRTIIPLCQCCNGIGGYPILWSALWSSSELEIEPLLQYMECNTGESIRSQNLLRSHDTPGIQNVSTGDFQVGGYLWFPSIISCLLCWSSRQKVLQIKFWGLPINWKTGWYTNTKRTILFCPRIQVTPGCTLYFPSRENVRVKLANNIRNPVQKIKLRINNI